MLAKQWAVLSGAIDDHLLDTSDSSLPPILYRVLCRETQREDSITIHHVLAQVRFEVEYASRGFADLWQRTCWINM